MDGTHSPDISQPEPARPAVAPVVEMSTQSEAAEIPEVSIPNSQSEEASATDQHSVVSDAINPSGEDHQISGFERPSSPIDEIAAKHYREAGLSEAPSMADLEPKALELFRTGNPSDAMKAVEMVLGRRVDSMEFRDNVAMSVILMPGVLDPDTKFGLVLLQAGIEQLKGEHQK